MKTLKPYFQNLVIGFGKGGKTLAAYLARQGREVALVERSEMRYGGTCINVACIPTKSLITSAERKVPYTEAVGIKNNLTAALRQKNFENLDNHPLITVITGVASFVSDHTVNITLGSSGEQVRIEAERIFINTGTVPRIPDIPGLAKSRRVFTSESLMEQSGLPKELVVIGGGFVGLEFADMYAKFGSVVTLLDHKDVFLPGEDRDIADEIRKVMEEKAIRIRNGVVVQNVTDTNDGVRVRYRDMAGMEIELDASALLLATGRRPDLEDLNLQGAGIKTDAQGFVEVNDRLETNVENIWAIGDVNGGPQFTYISLDDFRIIRDQIFGGEYVSVKQRKAVASSVFITPPLAHIGLREHEAVEKGYRIKVASLPPAAVPRARILDSPQGLMKSVIDVDTNKILGCTLFCVEASEMINTIQIAINAGMDYREVRDTIFTHPSMTEAFNDLYASV